VSISAKHKSTVCKGASFLASPPADKGVLEITQRGVRVVPGEYKGPIRLRLRAKEA